MPSVTVVLPWCCPVAATMTALRLMSCRVGEGKRGSEHARWHPRHGDRDAQHRPPEGQKVVIFGRWLDAHSVFEPILGTDDL